MKHAGFKAGLSADLMLSKLEGGGTATKVRRYSTTTYQPPGNVRDGALDRMPRAWEIALTLLSAIDQVFGWSRLLYRS